MDHHLWVNPSHVGVRPSKIVMMLLEEVDEYKAEVGSELSANLELMVLQV